MVVTAPPLLWATTADWPSFIENSALAQTRSWRGCPMVSSSKEWPRCATLATRLVRAMPSVKKSIGSYYGAAEKPRLFRYCRSGIA